MDSILAWINLVFSIFLMLQLVRTAKCIAKQQKRATQRKFSQTAVDKRPVFMYIYGNIVGFSTEIGVAK